MTSEDRGRSRSSAGQVVAAMPTAAKAKPMSIAAGDRQQRRAATRSARGWPSRRGSRWRTASPRMSAQAISPRATSADAQRRRQHRVVGLGVAQLEEDVEGGVVDRAVHRRRGQQRPAPRRPRRPILRRRTGSPRRRGCRSPKPMAEQVEERLEEARDEDDPGPPVDQHVALDEPRPPRVPLSSDGAIRASSAMPAHQGPTERVQRGGGAEDDVRAEHEQVGQLIAPVGLIAEDEARASATPW